MLLLYDVAVTLLSFAHTLVAVVIDVVLTVVVVVCVVVGGGAVSCLLAAATATRARNTIKQLEQLILRSRSTANIHLGVVDVAVVVVIVVYVKCHRSMTRGA